MITQTEVERARLLPNFSPVIMRHAQLPGTALTLSSSGSRTMPGFHGTILRLLSHPSILTLGISTSHQAAFVQHLPLFVVLLVRVPLPLLRGRWVRGQLNG